jgi:hypothetical protein
MKKLLPLLISALILSSCSSTTKNLQRGNYDRVIQKTTKKLMKKPNAKDAEAMDRAYRLANERDLERVTYLQREDNPDFYEELFARYNTLKNRQSQVRTVTPLTVEGKTYSYEYVDYDAKIVESKRKAADEFYKQGKMLLENPKSKMDFRAAHFNLIRADELAGSQYPDIEKMIYDARMNGISRVIVVPVADENAPVTKVDLESLVTFDPSGLKGNDWIEYHFKDMGANVAYDYELVVNINTIEVTPDAETQTRQDYKKKSTKEFEYALDANNNVMKDTAGNDIKIYKDVEATMIKTHKEKMASIRGEVVVVDKETQKMSMPVPFAAESKFVNDSYDIVGKEEAVPLDLINLAKKPEVPFPSEAVLIKECLDKAQPAVREAIYSSSQKYIR